MTEEKKKVLGPSKYANAKKKKKVTQKKKDPKISRQNSDLRVKMKHIQKEITRLESAAIKDSKQIKDLEKKLEKLSKINDSIKS